MNRSYKYLIAVLIVIVLFLTGGGIYYFINKYTQISIFNQQKNQYKEIIVEEISNANGLKAEVRIKGHQYSVVLIENGVEKNIDYCFENPASSIRERNSEIGLDCSSFTKLEFSPKENYLIYLMTNSTAPTQRFLYNIKTGKKEEVEDVAFSDDEKYFSSCIANDEGSIYSGVIYSGESFYQAYSVPSDYAPSLDCRKTAYDKENNTFTFVFNGSINRSIEYNLNTGIVKEFDQGNPKNQIDKIRDYFSRADDSAKYFCASKKNNYLLVCQEKDKCIKISNANDLSSEFELSFKNKEIANFDEAWLNNLFNSTKGGYYDKDISKKSNATFYYLGREEGGMSKLYIEGTIRNVETGFELSDHEQISAYCDYPTEKENQQCFAGIRIEEDKVKKEYSEKYRKLLKNVGLVNTFDCEN